MDEFDFNITVVGLGLIGGSYAMALRQLKPKKLYAVDVNDDILKEAEKRGIIDKGYLNPKVPLQCSDIVVVCLYPNKVVNFIKENMNNFKNDSIITDVTGIKQKLFMQLRDILPHNVDFIGGHPMAGKESSGFCNASKDIFKNANYIITPQPQNKEKNIVLIENIAKKIGCKNVVRVSCEKHDKLIAYTSQLPHVIASALVNSSCFDEIKYFIGGSFKDAIRVAKINSLLWTELLLNNSQNVIEQIENFEKSVNLIKETIKQNDKIKLQNLFEGDI